MVNITVFGPWSGKKTVTVDKAGMVDSGSIGVDSYDTEAHLLPVMKTDSRWNRRGKFCCLAMVADVCAFLALMLIIISTGFLLWKVWWVKAEVDKMEPAVLSLSASLRRLRVESEALQSENRALISAYSMQTADKALSGSLFQGPDMTLEDVNSEVLFQLARQEVDDAKDDQVAQLESDLFGMTVFVASTKSLSGLETSNWTDKLESLFGQAASDDQTDDSSDSEDDDLFEISRILDAGDNVIPTTVLPAVAEQTLDEDDESDAVPLPTFESPVVVHVDDDEDDDDDSDKPKGKFKDLDEDETDDDEDARGGETAYQPQDFSNSD